MIIGAGRPKGRWAIEDEVKKLQYHWTSALSILQGTGVYIKKFGKGRRAIWSISRGIF